MDYSPKRTRNLYQNHEEKPYKLSRSKVELFIDCPRCFYLDRKIGIARPPIPSFNLNLAVGALLKKEFDQHRSNNSTPDILKNYDPNLKLFSHENLDKWRENFVGIQYLHEDTNFLLTGAIDDVGIKDEKLVVIDFKATSTIYPISYKGEKYNSYKRQLEFYSYLYEKNGFKTYEKSLFLVCNADKNKPRFNNVLEFDTSIIEHKNNLSWIDDTIFHIYEVLQNSSSPEPSKSCHICAYKSEIDLL